MAVRPARSSAREDHAGAGEREQHHAGPVDTYGAAVHPRQTPQAPRFHQAGQSLVQASEASMVLAVLAQAAHAADFWLVQLRIATSARD